MAESRNRSLTTLPLLVIVGIAEALCPHCSEDPGFSSWQTAQTPTYSGSCEERPRISNNALANLAATCKDMHALVTPILYHRAQCDPEQRVSLLRTLAGRPDLARHVKFLGLDVGGCWAELKGEDDKAFVLELAARHGWAPRPLTAIEIENGIVENDERTGRSRAGGDLPMNLLMALCPNLEKFSAELDYFYDFDLLQPASLPHLKDVYIAHRDTEGGTNLGALEALYLAAPFMETFTSYMTDGVGETILPLGNLRHVCLSWSAISAGCLRTLLKSCPQLESFEYEAGGPCVGYEQFSITKMMELLVRHVPRLKRLVLTFGLEIESNDSDDDLDDDDDEHDDVEPAPGFASLSHLETLVVEPKTVAVLGGQQPVATLFPQSLQSLTVTTYRLPIELGGMDMKAFVSTARTFLPNLTSVASLSRGDRPGVEYHEYLPDPEIS